MRDYPTGMDEKTGSLGGIRGGTGGVVPMLQRARVDVVLYNSDAEITDDTPDGGEETLASAHCRGLA